MRRAALVASTLFVVALGLQPATARELVPRDVRQLARAVGRPDRVSRPARSFAPPRVLRRDECRRELHDPLAHPLTNDLRGPGRHRELLGSVDRGGPPLASRRARRVLPARRQGPRGGAADRTSDDRRKHARHAATADVGHVVPVPRRGARRSQLATVAHRARVPTRAAAERLGALPGLLGWPSPRLGRPSLTHGIRLWRSVPVDAPGRGDEARGADHVAHPTHGG